MKNGKRILLVHSDAKARRVLASLMCDAGYEVSEHAGNGTAAGDLLMTSFDVAVVSDQGTDSAVRDVVDEIKRTQPDAGILLLVPQYGLDAVMRGLDLSVSEVIPCAEDGSNVLRSVNRLLHVNSAEPTLSRREVPIITMDTDTDHLQRENEQLMRERNEFRQMAEHLEQEKSALDAELKELRKKIAAEKAFTEVPWQQRNDIMAAANSSLEAKAREIAAEREQLARERLAFADEKKKLQGSSSSPHALKSDVQTRVLQAEEKRLRDEAMRLSQLAAALMTERKQIQDDMELLREQEHNLRAYEQRLRAQPAPAAPVAHEQSSGFVVPENLREEWNRLNTMADRLSAEQRNLRGEQMTLKEERAQLKAREKSLQEREQIMETLAKAPMLPAQPQPQAQPKYGFSRTPFRRAKRLITGNS